eukprot:CAMPEP_0169077170 /NCGR_PEP_ID=MMETSP1015-20121227/8735_1 /TAXON_ID=342587 /ORGANISM="Karlodinium micrum, Strain CCMP2283" /LENGTH=77 /DNA_ID=CAMNT_0009136675 /DNA_START=20 /DNA_END=250 /DNA_ORIENTATION=+
MADGRDEPSNSTSDEKKTSDEAANGDSSPTSALLAGRKEGRDYRKKVTFSEEDLKEGSLSNEKKAARPSNRFAATGW